MQPLPNGVCLEGLEFEEEMPYREKNIQTLEALLREAAFEELHWSFKQGSVRIGEKFYVQKLFLFKRTVKQPIYKVYHTLHQMGLVGVQTRQLLNFVMDNPHLQKKFAIVGLGTIVCLDGDDTSPYLGMYHTGKRSIAPLWHISNIEPAVRILAMPRPPNFDFQNYNIRWKQEEY